jgi:putative transposase
MARLVIPGYPHHITQRGNRKQSTFFCDADYLKYRSLLRANLPKSGVEIWAYCLLPNHVHLVAVPNESDGLARLLRVTHHRYARHINARNNWQGHLWQERFHSFPMDEPHLLAAVRYVELNPVRAGLCEKPEQWRWSSVHAHLGGTPDPLLNPAPMADLVTEWATYLSAPGCGPTDNDLRWHTGTGRPAGNDAFIRKLESLSGRRLRPLKPGPKPRS